ncbi:MAG: hypothetical protein AAFV53_42395 [Myxococcota bacterium]
MASKSKIQLFLHSLRTAGLLTVQKGAPAALSADDGVKRKQAMLHVLVLWHRVFIDVSDEDFHAAVEGFYRSAKSQWYPSPGTLREFLPEKLTRDLIADSAVAAWAELWQGFRMYGCPPGQPKNAYLWQFGEGDPYYGPRWRWSGSEGEVAAKEYALSQMGGWDALLKKRRDDNETSLLRVWEAAFRSYVRHNDLREQLTVTRQLSGEVVEIGPRALPLQRPVITQTAPAQIAQDLDRVEVMPVKAGPVKTGSVKTGSVKTAGKVLTLPVLRGEER